MKVRVTKNASLDACTITHDSVRLETLEDVAKWRLQLMELIQAAVGSGRAYLLVDDNGFSVNPRVAEAYGRVAEELRIRFAKEVFRYGATDPLSSASARLQSIKRTHNANMFATRQQAIDALNREIAKR